MSKAAYSISRKIAAVYHRNAIVTFIGHIIGYAAFSTKSHDIRRIKSTHGTYQVVLSN